MSSSYETEAKQRWGQTEAYAIAAKRTKNYSSTDWALIKSEAATIYQGFYAHRSQPAESAEIKSLVQAWREHLDRWYYPCSMEMLVGLADIYEQDVRFQQNIDKVGGEGTCACMIDAIRDYSSRVSSQSISE